MTRRIITRLSALLVLLTLNSCSLEPQKPLKLVANSWIGYSPLFYAHEKGWLKNSQIELTQVVSLGESLTLYENTGFDAFSGTQFEFQQAKSVFPDLMPIILLDKSNGGDMVMSNTSIQSLQNSQEIIDVYLEINSVNYIIFKDFIRIHQLESKTFNFINQDQLKITTLVRNRQNSLHQNHSSTEAPYFLVITYEPFNHTLSKNGLTTIESTADSLNLLVIDALYARPEIITQHQKQLKELKRAIDKSIDNLKTDPKEYYEKVKGYLENPTYEEFQSSIRSIEWIHQNPHPTLTERLKKADFPLSRLMTP